ncbi:hypothetical protein PL373_18975 [Tenacibaculum maritimum]|nr:hypothetical protein [Tenacibaculum maritimum]MDB0603172.1 hypothetical protein [Tenacibaculum maritimum]MDB0610435.1 hypothetical protein [Tenacibaculum maritimum]
MKKLLFIIALLTTTIIVGQNESFKNIEKLREKLNNFDSITARKFADNIAYSTKTKYKFYKVKNHKKSNIISYYYLKTELTKEQLGDIKDFGCNGNCLIVYFDVYYEGANIDLELKETKKIVFSNVGGKYLDVFPTWKREFFPTTTKEEALKSHKKRTLYKGNSAVARFQRQQGNFWTIRYYR